MTYVVLPDKGVGDTFTEAMWDTYLKDNLNKGVVRPIAEATVTGSPSSQLDFQTIAADWSHLFLELYARGDAAAADVSLYLRLNNDSGANYDHHYLRGSGSVVDAQQTLAAAQISLGSCVPAATAPANVFGLARIELPHYAQATNQKGVLGHGRLKRGVAAGDLHTLETGGYWRNAAIVNRITLLLSSGSFAVGTRATLYGMGGV